MVGSHAALNCVIQTFCKPGHSDLLPLHVSVWEARSLLDMSDVAYFVFYWLSQYLWKQFVSAQYCKVLLNWTLNKLNQLIIPHNMNIKAKPKDKLYSGPRLDSWSNWAFDQWPCFRTLVSSVEHIRTSLVYICSQMHGWFTLIPVWTPRRKIHVMWTLRRNLSAEMNSPQSTKGPNLWINKSLLAICWQWLLTYSGSQEEPQTSLLPSHIVWMKR